MEAKMKHLELIQAVINRMTNTSFLLKGWSVTLVAALMALAAKDAKMHFIFISFVPVIVFWVLDTFYVRQERLFRKLYDFVRGIENDQIDFSMNVDPFDATEKPLKVFFSKTLLCFYGVLLFAVICVIISS